MHYFGSSLLSVFSEVLWFGIHELMQHADAAMEAITHGTKSLFTLCKPDILFCSFFFPPQICT